MQRKNRTITKRVPAAPHFQSTSAHNGWIACADRLPDDDLTVLVFLPGASEPVWLGFYSNEYWYHFDSDLLESEKMAVTHWMPLPQGPFDS